MGLLSLLAEVLGMICEEFCLHCRKAGSHRRYYFEIGEVYIPPENASLVALLQTCKLLYRTALPYLYHRPVGREFLNLTRALDERPQLGGYVKQISVTRAISYSTLECLTPTHFGFLRPFLEACDHMRDTALYQFARECEWLPLPKSLAEHLSLPKLMFDDEYDTLFITLVLSMTPNLKKLEIGLREYWKFRWCRPNSLLFLRELTITQWSGWPESNTNDISGLLAAAPGLERLKFVNVGEMPYDPGESNKPYLHHANVREVTLEACDLPYANFMMLMLGFPNLQTFRYDNRCWVESVSKRSNPLPWAMGQIVILKKDTLRHLSLQHYRLRLSKAIRESSQDLSGMAALETLHVNCQILSRKSNGRPKAGLTICELLPSSIKEFGLMGKAKEHLYEEVLELITTSNRAFPHLRNVIVTSCGQDNGFIGSRSRSRSLPSITSDDDSFYDSPDDSSDGISDDYNFNNDRSGWVERFFSACMDHNIQFSTEEP